MSAWAVWLGYLFVAVAVGTAAGFLVEHFPEIDGWLSAAWRWIWRER